jgi:hypothetical protein
MRSPLRHRSLSRLIPMPAISPTWTSCRPICRNLTRIEALSR